MNPQARSMPRSSLANAFLAIGIYTQLGNLTPS